VIKQLVLNHSLRKHASKYPLVVFATPARGTDGLPEDARAVLKSQGIAVRDIEFLQPQESNQAVIADADDRFADTWTKLRCFELIEYKVSSVA
jgi:alpha-N-acetylglucosamine transferase